MAETMLAALLLSTFFMFVAPIVLGWRGDDGPLNGIASRKVLIPVKAINCRERTRVGSGNARSIQGGCRRRA
jgi:hypothetical protein